MVIPTAIGCCLIVVDYCAVIVMAVHNILR